MMDVTMDMLDHLSAQDVFDIAAYHMLRQGVRGADDKGHCLYRAPNSTRCAVGWLIPDSVYDTSMEDQTVCDLALRLCDERHDSDRARFGRFLIRHSSLLAALQYIHDGTTPYLWASSLYDLADRWMLSPRVATIVPSPPPLRTAKDDIREQVEHAMALLIPRDLLVRLHLKREGGRYVREEPAEAREVFAA
jgi:hypothetical protein